ncbi:cyclic AMP-dependent transcription factor ATF-3-like [Gigantopelta aegis]|uniref:cyclic AMP-dependent transcription factor ATF-3-like n=1 Tax=Gigantopelta aegis TaxID=1735272 RepID=UPI001B88E424|nr:cyclic AMP-dependent transcription factor ATF-3-like [Gigantopelta aegis]
MDVGDTPCGLSSGGLLSVPSGCDTRLERAAARAAETNNLTPLLKEELRLQILTKRHAKGKTEIDIDFKTEPRSYKLRPDEIEKKRRRREQNRVAAQKCRQKKKICQTYLFLEYQRQQQRNKELEEQVRQLRFEKSELEAFVQDHFASGACALANLEADMGFNGCSLSDFGFLEDVLNLPED